MAPDAPAEALTRLAIWRLSPNRASQIRQQVLRRPERLVAQAMAIGTSADAEFVETVFGIEAMRHVLADAPAGIFDPRKWDYWHLRFGYRRTPPLPTRPT